MFCKLANYITFKYPTRRYTFWKSLNLKDFKNQRTIKRINLKLREEECTCSECKPDTSNGK